MKFLLDTCVISELIARQPSTKVIDWLDSVEDDHIYLSVITIGEIKRGIEKLPDSGRKTAIQEWFSEHLLPRFAGRILPIDVAVMLTWGELVARLEAQGRKLSAIDSLIAALALQNGLTLVTRNTKDFMGTAVSLLDPWQTE